MTTRVLHGDALAILRTLPDASAQCCVTSPPYFGLRDYGVSGQIGLEPTPEAYLARMVEVFRDVRRVLRPDGVCFVNMGDSYSSNYGKQRGSGEWFDGGRPRELGTRPTVEAGKPKDLLMMPSRLALALQADGWWLRSMMPWLKRSCMPESTTDRPTSAIEYVFMFTKSARYFWDAEAVKRGVTGGAHPRGNGLTPKSAAPGSGTKANASFHTAVKDLVGCRNFRNSDLFFDSLGIELPEQRAPSALQRIKVPGGWEVKPGAHGTIHRDGRTAATYTEYRGQSTKGHDAAGVQNASDVKRRTLAAMAARGIDGNKYVNQFAGPPPEPLGLICDEAGDPLALDVNPEPFPEAHFATYPTKLIEPLIRAASKPGDTVLDPFLGSGTTALVADRLGRDCIGIELNETYAEMARKRLMADAPMFAEVERG